MSSALNQQIERWTIQSAQIFVSPLKPLYVKKELKLSYMSDLNEFSAWLETAGFASISTTQTLHSVCVCLLKTGFFAILSSSVIPPTTHRFHPSYTAIKVSEVEAMR